MNVSPSYSQRAMKSQSGLSAPSFALSGSRPFITSQRSLTPSPSESQSTGFVPSANSSRSVRPSLSVSRSMEPLSSGLNAAAISSGAMRAEEAGEAMEYLRPSSLPHTPFVTAPTLA